MPTSEQVGIVWVDEDPYANIRPRDLLIYGHSGNAYKVQYYYGCYDPLQYPLLFSYGEPEWHEGIDKVNLNVSQIPVTQNLVDVVNMNSTYQLLEI